MDVENQKIKMRVNNFNEYHFKSLGYNVKKNDYITIFVKELPKGSGLKIDVECAYCGKIFKKAFRRYLETKDKLCCKECRSIKMMEISLVKYGNVCSLRNDKVLKKSKETNLKELGVEYPFQNKDILRKCTESRIANGHVILKGTSKQQLYLSELYCGIFNYSVFPYTLDIYFEKESIYLEYDGSGHFLCVKLDKLTEEEFSAKEEERSRFLKEMGFKEFRIISSDDVLPSDDELLSIKDRGFKVLLEDNFNKYVYNLNTKTESFEE